MKRLGLILVLAVGCSSKAGKETNAQRNDSVVPGNPPAGGTSADLPAMPPYPEAVRGRMSVLSAQNPGMDSIRHERPAQAGVCKSPPMLLVKSEEMGSGGTMVLLALPENKVGRYPITLVEQGLPTPPAAQIGVQVFRNTGAVAYQALDGSVEVYAFGNTVSGRFAVTLREINRNERIRYVGAFKEVPVMELEPALCVPAEGGTP